MKIIHLIILVGLCEIRPENLHAAPSATTFPATSVGSGIATLNATVNASNVNTRVYFQYGLTTSYDSISPKTTVSGTTTVGVSNAITGLLVGTFYHFRAVATNSAGTNFGSDLTFTTAPAAAPTITTNFANIPGVTNVTLNGKLFANGLESSAWFEYGLTTNYGSATTTTNLGGGTTNRNFVMVIGGLATGATYYYHAVATNSLGSNYGIGQSFTAAIFANVTNITGNLYGVNNRSAAWGDYDNDGLLDYLTVAPSDFNFSVLPIMHNKGSNFANVSGTVASGLPQLSFRKAAWVDYDNDGRSDFVLSGNVSANPVNYPIVQFWHNTGSNFVNVTDTVIPGGGIGLGADCFSWGDYDNDGWVDLLLTGSTLHTSVTAIWHNTGSNFVDVTTSVAPIELSFNGVENGCGAWGDYDNDGRLDFIVTGLTFGNFTPIAQIWHNTGSNFVNVTATIASGLDGHAFGAVAWGDYNNDGRLDLVLSGGNAGTTQIWLNTGTNFVNVTTNVSPSLTGVSANSVAWIDYNNDGRLDLLISGTQVWLNYSLQNTNTLPTAPSGLAMTWSTNGALLSWKPATDNGTPSAGLSYNVRAGSTSGGVDLISPESDTNGFRLLPAMGNAEERLFMPLAGVTNGQTIYWSVQAVDTTFAGGPFATQCSVVSVPQMNLTTGTNTVLSWTPLTWGWHLQESSGLNIWSDSSIGEVNPVTILSTNTAKFYRLVDP